MLGGDVAEKTLLINHWKKKDPIRNKNLNLQNKVVRYIDASKAIRTVRKGNYDPRLLKPFNKARKIGTLKGAIIGAGLGLGSTLLTNKIKDRKKDK